MAYRDEGKLTYKFGLTHEGRRRRFTCGTESNAEAERIEAQVVGWQGGVARRPDAIAALVAGKATARDLFDAHQLGQLDGFLDKLNAPAPVDLSPWLERFIKKEAKGRQEQQLRVLVPEGVPFPVTKYSKSHLSTFLEDLEVSGSTKVRYHSALSVFGDYLVLKDVLSSNPLRLVPRAEANESRWDVHYSREDAQRLVYSLEGDQRIMEAIFAGTGMEYCAAEAAHRRDVNVDERTIFAHGTKNKWRKRLTWVTEDWCWEIIEKGCRNLHPDAPLFTLDRFRALGVHKAAAKRLDLPETTLHDWRHTYAIYTLDNGESLQFVSRQLGHRDTLLLQTNYARHYRPEPPKTSGPAILSATPIRAMR